MQIMNRLAMHLDKCVCIGVCACARGCVDA